jgi:hypothetical protein
MKKKSFDIFLLLLIIFFVNCSENKKIISKELFRHHFITDGLPDEKNSRYGTPILADLDRDGDLDYALSITRGKFFWFEYDAGRWSQHTAGDIPTGQLGANILDVDQDGWIDMVTGGYWFRNPQQPKEREFERYQYDDRIETEIHDMVIADINGDMMKDVVVLGDREGCYWYSVPENPIQNLNWPRTTITLDVLNERDDIHAGFFPQGIADLDHDGDNDVVLPDRWFENNQNGSSWSKHPLPWGKVGPWGLSSRSWIVDLDMDGDNDIVIVDCDQKESRGAILENDGNIPPNFIMNPLPQPAPGKRGSFHSLALSDFDGDGDLDIFTAEQQDETILPEGAGPRGYIWENLDGKGKEFSEIIIFDQMLGAHDALIGDVDSDGDIDICFKVWPKWEYSSNSGRFHADFLENQLR